MGFTKKEWKDRIAEYINRRTIIKSDESSEVVTVERNEGTISQEGDAFNADTMNDLEERIATAFETVDIRLDGLSFVKLTQSEYDALDTKDANTIYFTTE